MRTSLLCLCLFFTGLFSSQAQAQAQEKGWLVEAQSINEPYFGVTVANGMLGLISSKQPLKVNEVVLNGVFDTYGRGRVSNIMQVFSFANFEVNVDDRLVTEKNISAYKQWIDLKTATFYTTFEVPGKIRVRYGLRALRHLPYSALVDLEFEALSEVEITVTNSIITPDHLRDVHNYFQEINRPHAVIPLMTSVAKTPTGKHTVAVSNSFMFSEDDKPRLIHEEWDSGMHLARFKKALKKGQSYSFSLVGSVISTEHVSDPHNEAERLSIYANLEGRERLIKRHNEAWQELWKSDIVVEGNLQHQLDIRFALYHLYSFARKGTAYSLSPMGLSGLGYNGHIFWDTELWMFPPLLLLQPEIAKSLLDYRYERLEMAKQNAFSHGYDGAMFPWESDDVGQEATPVWALSGPFEHHITGVVGIAFWNYYRVTQDKKWLEETGFEVLKEVADFWVSRVELGDDGMYHINNVVAADEWAENVDDNAFTNAAAQLALQYADRAAKVLGVHANPKWANVAEKIVILRFPDGTVREHATYEGEPIKQADVNLLSFPLGLITDEETQRKNMDYYLPRIGQGPAMSHSVFAALYARLGDRNKALELFERSYQPNRVPPFGVMAEYIGGQNPYFATGAGGMLQAVIQGFAGIEITDSGLKKVDSVLPKGWKNLKIVGVGRQEKTFDN